MLTRISIGLLLCLASVEALAQKPTETYPDKPIRVLVGFAAGGPTDVIARGLADYTSRRLHQPVIVENKPGANTIIAADNVAASTPDGYTLLAAATNHTMIPALYGERIKFDAVKSFAPICTVAVSPTVLVVGPSFKVSTVSEFLADVRANPGSRSFATPGTGSGGHFATEAFANLTGLKMNHIPYKGAAPAMNDLMAGQVDLSFATLASVLPQIISGKLTAIAVASGSRSPFLPDVPTFEESGIHGFSADAWYGVLAPANTPEDVQGKLRTAFESYAKEPETVDRLSSMGLQPQSICGAAFTRLLEHEVELNLKLARALDLKID